MARTKKVRVTEFKDALADILAEYADDITDEMPELVTRVGKKCRDDVVANIAQAGIGGTKYRNSIEVSIQKGRHLAEAKISSPRHGQLTHLLEHGHVIKAHGKVYGTTRAFPHWRQAEEVANRTLEEEIKKAVQQ